MTCIVCKNGETTLGTTTVTLERDGATLVFKDVPARICQNCGEAYVEDATTQRLLHQAEEALVAGVQVEIRQFAQAV